MFIKCWAQNVLNTRRQLLKNKVLAHAQCERQPNLKRRKEQKNTKVKRYTYVPTMSGRSQKYKREGKQERKIKK